MHKHITAESAYEPPVPARTGPGRKKRPDQKQAAKEARQASKVSATQSHLIPLVQTSKRAYKRVNVISSSQDE